MISLIAIDDGDGWAFVRQGYGIYLIRPPYSPRQHLIEVSEATVEKAVHAHRFHPELRDFADFDAVIAFLRGRLAEAIEGERARREELVDDRKDLVRRFPRAMERWGEGLVGLMRAVRQRGSLMAMGE